MCLGQLFTFELKMFCLISVCEVLNLSAMMAHSGFVSKSCSVPDLSTTPQIFSGRKGWKFYQSLTHLFSSSFKATWFSNVASPSPQTFLSGGRKNVESEGSHDWTDKATDIVCHRAETHMQFCNIAEFLLEPETCFCDFYLLL